MLLCCVVVVVLLCCCCVVVLLCCVVVLLCCCVVVLLSSVCGWSLVLVRVLCSRSCVSVSMRVTCVALHKEMKRGV